MEYTSTIHVWIERIALAMEVFAILVIVVGMAYGAAKFIAVLLHRGDSQSGYTAFKAFMGRTLLLGLEILVAADVVRTIALEPTLNSVAVLGILVLIRTFLSWSLVVEIEGRWPWRSAETEPSNQPE